MITDNYSSYLIWLGQCFIGKVGWFPLALLPPLPEFGEPELLHGIRDRVGVSQPLEMLRWESIYVSGKGKDLIVH